MASDARENYRAVFGVYPNECKPSRADRTQTDAAGKIIRGLENATRELAGMWEKSEFTGISERAQSLLRQIQTATSALRSELEQPNSP